MAADEILRDVGPVDVNSAGELVSKVGVHNQAKRLIKQVAENFPPELVAAGSRRRLAGRSGTLDLSEVTDAAKDAFPDFTELLSAAVRGSEERPETMVVNVVCRSESGRSFRGILPYEELSKSKAAYTEGVKNGTVIFNSDDPQAQKTALSEAQRTIAALEKRLEDAGGEPEEVETPEPFEGYEAAKAPDLIAAINDGEYDLQTLFAIRTAEQEGKERSTVEEAIDAKIEAAEAALKPDSSGDGDNSGD
ncbi:MAG: hypothetical protein ACRDPE_15195 [Solirubrobacterales bacterium]